MEFKYKVKASDLGRSYGQILQATFGISSLLLKKIRLYGSLLVNGKPKRMIDKAELGDEISAFPAKDKADVVPFRVKRLLNIPIIYEDDHVVIVNKPADLVVHPSFTHPNGSLIDLLADRTLHPVTRLDRETSGLMILAKHPYAHYRLMQNKMTRKYLAISHGIWAEKEGLIDAPIRRCPDSIILRIVAPDGKVAQSHYRVLAESVENNCSLLEFNLVTGRTHQIRVHSLYSGRPLLADGLYGLSDYIKGAHNKPVPQRQKDLSRIKEDQQVYFKSLLNTDQYQLDLKLKRQALHAYYLDFYHPISSQKMVFNIGLDKDMDKLMELF